MMRNVSAAVVFASALLLAVPSLAQIGIPGSGPLTPDGPRRGLGPPSITDSVPDLRLQPGGAAPSYTPPSYGQPRYQGGASARISGQAPLTRRSDRVERRRVREVGAQCRTSKRTCDLARPRILNASCTCRVPRAGRVRGIVVP